MDSCFPVGNSVLLYLILHFTIAGKILAPVALKHTADKRTVCSNPAGRLLKELSLIDQRTQETSAWLVVC